MAEPIHSVVIIFLDAAPFLGAAMESVFVQTEERWELLLVDDGSTDGSGALADAAAARDPSRVRVLRHPGGENRGMSASRNLGLAEARGRYVAFLDGDDVWLPERLARHGALLDTHPECAMVCGPTRLWFSWVEGRGAAAFDDERDPLRRLGVEQEGPLAPPDYLVRVLDEAAKSPAICSFTARTEAVRAVGGFDDDFRGMFEDQVFFAKLLADHVVLPTGDCLDLYRQHPRSACYAARLQGHYHGSLRNPEQRAFVERLEERLGSRRAAHPDLARALDRWHGRYRHPVRTWLGDARRDPRRALRATLRGLAARVLPTRVYRRIWARAQGFDDAHGEPRT